MTPSVDLYEIEVGLRQRGLACICGIDEAGRGPLAGPVAAAAVILRPDAVIEGLNDSKKVSERKREWLYDVIIDQAVAWSVGLADEREIDDINILQATFLAMRRAVSGLSVLPDRVLVDGNLDPNLGLPTTTLIGGDGRSACIAAASILAKVTRDRLMRQLDTVYPQYGFARHKGYPTREHYQAITQYGVLPIHRKSFLKKFRKAGGE